MGLRSDIPGLHQDSALTMRQKLYCTKWRDCGLQTWLIGRVIILCENALVSVCSAPETGCEGSLCDLSTWQMEAGGSSVGGHPWLHSDPKANLGYMRSCLNSKQNKKIERKKERKT